MMWATTEASKEQRALKNNGEMRERTKSNVSYNKGRYIYPKNSSVDMGICLFHN